MCVCVESVSSKECMCVEKAFSRAVCLWCEIGIQGVCVCVCVCVCVPEEGVCVCS